jgi:hypothetical protein
MASLSDILTTAKNIVTAISQLGQTYLSVEGSKVTTGITTATLVQSGQGRIARVSVVVAGPHAGSIYDASSATATTGLIYAIPKDVGITEVNLPVNNGIVVVPSTGQTVAISYS